ncbi:MAG: SdiA-regulated domain-containing protein [Pseudomonadales bacterium]
MSRSKKITVVALGLLLVVALLLASGYHQGMHHQIRFAWWQWGQEGEPSEKAIQLDTFYAVVDAKPIENLNDEISALTFDPDRRTLFAVTNQNPSIVELSLDGRLLRRVKLQGFIDPEAIEYFAKDQYVVSDERDQRLVKVRLKDGVTEVNSADFQQLSFGLELNGNKGFEGLAYDHRNKRLFVAKERDPVRIYEIKGFPQVDQTKPMAVKIVDDPDRNAGLFVSDLSSLQYDDYSGHLLALSDQSHLILELDVTGWPISKLSLRGGKHGLKDTVPQAEGVAMDDEGVLYLVSEPDLFYVFHRKK